MSVNPEILKRLEAKLGRSRRRVYAMISDRVNEKKLPRHLAAIDLASDCGVNIAKYATREELAELRQSSPKSEPAVMHASDLRQSEPMIPKRKTGKPSAVIRKHDKGDSVFVVHGRDIQLRKSLFSFLRSIGLQPLEWSKALGLVGKPSPYVGEVLEVAFKKATAVVVLLTPDDEARLKAKFFKKDDQSYETELTGQPRPNVLFEAGMAFGTHQDKTVLIQVGDIRPFSDIAGRHVVRLSNSVESRKELMTKLGACGCTIDDSGSDWMTEGNFE